MCDHPLADIPGFDSSFRLEYFDSWSDWEEGGWLAIHTKDNQWYYQEYLSSVMANSIEEWSPTPCTEDEAIQMVLGWEENFEAQSEP